MRLSERPGTVIEDEIMFDRRRQWITYAVLSLTLFTSQINHIIAADLSGVAVKQSIDRGRRFLLSQQAADGSWNVDQDGFRMGVTSMVVMALLNCGMSPQDAQVKRGLDFIRKDKEKDAGLFHHETYQVALQIMALAAAKEGAVDKFRIANMAGRLENGQAKQGPTIGGWSYALPDKGAEGICDHSNSQFALLGLREAVEAGAKVDPETWKRARAYWERDQNGDGGWNYSDRGGSSYGSMTVAGVSSLVICEQMLRSDEGIAPDGTPPCCQGTDPNEPLDRGIHWMARNFAVGHNPGGANGWLLYYIYGVERAGRLSGVRFFGDHDWYREGAAYLMAMQNGASGYWEGVGTIENHKVMGTSMALLFLSKGLAPVLINKLKYGPRDPNRQGQIVGNDWNRHRRDVRNLVDLISGSPKWPKLLTSQDVDLARCVEAKSVDPLLQGSVLFITGEESPAFTAAELQLLKEYLENGGFIFAAPTCSSNKFETGFRALVQKIMPQGEGELKRLTQDHPVFKSEHLLLADSTPLFGVDFGCRTSIMFCPEDLGCLWDYWSRVDPLNRNLNLKIRIVRAVNIGVNVLAYATGREPPEKPDAPKAVKEDASLDLVERGLVQIAQIRHDGSWNAAPHALRRILMSLNETVAVSASTKAIDLEFSDPAIFQYPVLYMHGRNKFSAKEADRTQLRKYLELGGVLFVDSCCGSKQFDKGFRDFVGTLYRDKKLEKLGIDHELFTDKFGLDIRKLKRRVSEGSEAGGFVVREAEPFVEALEIDGRLAIIYSKYDISCALERQAAGSCEGYLSEDAVKLATNIIQYALLAELRLKVTETPAKAGMP